MSDIKLQHNWYDNALLCPVCDGNNLHQETVIMYDRKEDSDKVTMTSAYSGNVNMRTEANDVSGNPSARRHGLTIDFWCENCHGNSNEDPPEHKEYFKLAIQQHKGTTYFNWDVPKK